LQYFPKTRQSPFASHLLIFFFVSDSVKSISYDRIYTLLGLWLCLIHARKLQNNSKFKYKSLHASSCHVLLGFSRLSATDCIFCSCRTSAKVAKLPVPVYRIDDALFQSRQLMIQSRIWFTSLLMTLKFWLTYKVKQSEKAYRKISINFLSGQISGICQYKEV